MSINTEMVHVIEKFDGKNFHLWKFKIQIVLEDKDLWSIVDGSEPRPEDQKETKVWDKRAKKAFMTICLNLKNSQYKNPYSWLTEKLMLAEIYLYYSILPY